MTILDQLVDFYNRHESFHKARLSDSNIRDYFLAMGHGGRLIVCVDGEKLLGYCDFSRLNFSQLGYVVLSDIASPEINDSYGSIVFVNTVCVAPEARGLGVVKYLHKELINRNPDASYIVGKRQGKRYKPIVIFKRGKNKVVEHGNV